MEHLASLALARPDRPTCLTIGAFDGVHRGHQRVVEELVAVARQKGYRAAVLTFFPLPRQVINHPEPHYYLTTPEERARLLEALGVDLVITHPFDEQVRSIRAADFVDQLVNRLDVREIWVGPDFALGYRREGDVPFLEAQGSAKGFVVHTVDFFNVAGVAVSSSMIRRAVRDGRVRDAREWLGRPFRLVGRVVRGDGRGRQLGFPTANLRIWPEHAFPARGVYAGCGWVDGLCYVAAINIGLRPTVTADEALTIEAHLVDFAGDLYDRELAVDFLDRIRDEVRFNRVELLTAQLERDVAQARRIVVGMAT